MAKILIVDDEEHIRKIMSIMLSRKGYTCQTASSAKEALELLEKNDFQAVLTDLKMPELDGLSLLAIIKNSYPDLVVIMITAFASVETAILAMKEGAYDYIAKPFNEEELLLTLEKALERSRLLDENRRLKQEIKERFDEKYFLGRSKAMQKIFDIIKKVADTKATILIQGESGTGKELAARSIHQNGPRKDKAFVAINCGAIPSNLLESEFFGHIKGAFTGADKAKKGLLEEANEGTVFLDEVADLPFEMQVKLLRALQEEEIKPVGANQTKKIDLRVLAATNKNLLEEIKKGSFREDLYYRLSVISLTMPPLRDKLEDIPDLAIMFLKQALKKHKIKDKKLSAASLKFLMSQNWPGNVRELKNAIEQAAVLSDEHIIEPKDFSLLNADNKTESAKNSVEQNVLNIPEENFDLKLFVKDICNKVEKKIIQKILQDTKGNRSKAALKLNLSRRALISKIKEYNLAED